MWTEYRNGRYFELYPTYYVEEILRGVEWNCVNRIYCCEYKHTEGASTPQIHNILKINLSKQQWRYLSSEVFEVFGSVNAPLFTVRAPVGVQDGHYEGGHLSTENVFDFTSLVTVVCNGSGSPLLALKITKKKQLLKYSFAKIITK